MAAQNSLFLPGYQVFGCLAAAPPGGWLSTPQIHISLWPCECYKFNY